jgi:hypothetical protein
MTMKRSPELQAVVDRMAPGVLSLEGFLGPDPRPLEEILDADDSAVVALGTTHAELAARLEACLETSRAGVESTVTVGGGLTADYAERMGRIPCPWGRCATFQKGEVTLRDASTGKAVRFSALSIHLIAEHGFYGGRGSRYRVEPADLRRLRRP